MTQKQYETKIYHGKLLQEIEVSYKPELPKGSYYSIKGKGNMKEIKYNSVPGSNKYDIEKSSVNNPSS